ncbi:hypothetical protein BJ508DRAFT_311349 [Ascobolus immersus RN42]|uniref:Uncharacterized protein n=1 Tax=Ascobolus immersus RN42 TaxID=1160509 RepID=A0A3N4HQN2_ASCIM|nr:hypothetical protein BJ508DRAFT_311349 [Ascobolus immersus RN42]
MPVLSKPYDPKGAAVRKIRALEKRRLDYQTRYNTLEEKKAYVLFFLHQLPGSVFVPPPPRRSIFSTPITAQNFHAEEIYFNHDESTLAKEEARVEAQLDALKRYEQTLTFVMSVSDGCRACSGLNRLPDITKRGTKSKAFRMAHLKNRQGQYQTRLNLFAVWSNSVCENLERPSQPGSYPRMIPRKYEPEIVTEDTLERLEKDMDAKEWDLLIGRVKMEFLEAYGALQTQAHEE